MNSYLKAGIVAAFFVATFVFLPNVTHAASRYWVGGGSSAAWSATSPTNWSDTSGGANNASVPTSADDVFFDAATSSPSTLGASISIRSLDMTGYAGVLTHSASVTLTTAGSGVTFKLSPTMTYTLGNAQSSALSFTGTSGTTAITTAGKTIGNITFNGSGGTFQLQDTLTSTGNFTRTNGTFDPNGQTVALTGAGTISITGATTFYNLTRTGTAAQTDMLSLAANTTVSNVLTLNGNSTTNRLLVLSSSLGTARTLSAASTSISYADFRDIAATGSGSWDLSAITGLSGDAGGNTGITFTPSQTQYWVGGSGNWSAASEWGTTSGGTGGRTPLPQDDVVFDNNSFNGTSQSVQLNMPRAGRSIDWSAYNEGQSPTWAAAVISWTFYGSMTLNPGIAIAGGFNVFAEGRGSYTYTSATKQLNSPLNIAMVGGTLTALDAFLNNSGVLLQTGTFDANNQNVTIGSLNASQTTSPRTITMGSGTWTITGTNPTTIWNTNATNFTVNPGSSTILINGAGSSARSFIGGGKTYNNLTIATDNIAIGTSGATFNTLAVNTAALSNGFKIGNGLTLTISNLTTNGSAGNLAKILSTSSGSAATLSKSTGTVSVDYMSIQDITATGGATWYAGANSTNVSGNTGWTFDAPGSLPVVSVQAASSVTNFTATLNGTIDSSGSASSTVRGFQYGTSTAYGFTTSTSGTYGAGVFSINIENLRCNTQYHVRSFATNSVGTSSSTDTTFTTAACPSTFYVATTGTSTNNGSSAYPWNLAAAFSGGGGAIQPGSTVYLKGGTYLFATSTGQSNYQVTVDGASGNPVTFQSAPGEWAVLDGNLTGVATKNITLLQNYGDYVTFRDFEITNSEPETRKIGDSSSNPAGRRANSIDDYGTGTKFINLIVHDTGQGIGAWMQAHDNEYYGNIVYNNGWDAPDRTHGHGFYTQNDTGYKHFSNNIAFNQFGAALRTGGTGDSTTHNYRWENNTLYGSQLGMAPEGPDIDNFYFYKFKTYNLGTRVGYEPQTGYQDAVVRKNYFGGGGVALFDFMNGLIFRNNTVIPASSCVTKTLNLSVVESWTPARFDIDENTYYRSCESFPFWSFKITHYNVTTSTPVNYGADYAFGTSGSQASTYGYTGKEWKTTTGFDLNSTYNDFLKPTSSVVIFEHKNRYDDNRSDFTIYNWPLANTVNIDPSSVLDIGDTYELRNSQDYFGDVLTGTYNGGSLTVPMTGRTLARPVGFSMYDGTWYNYVAPTSTFPEFGVFILKNTSGTTDNADPVISNYDSEVTTTTARLLWDTSEDTTGTFQYGLTTSYGTTVNETSEGFSTTHEVALTGLSSGATYHYRTTATDNNGNVTTSPDRTFTLSGADATAPIISSVTTSTATTTATIAWTTNEAATSLVDYGLSASYGSSSSSSVLVTSHSIVLTGLTASTTYHYRITSVDAATNTATTSNATFTTLSSGDVTPPVVALTSPTNGATVSGTISITASSSDASGVAGVQFYIDGVVLGSEDTSAPYEASWGTASSGNGSHTITAVARDASGNSATSSDVVVTVSNSSTGGGNSSSRSAPRINDLAIVVGTDSAAVSWETSEDTRFTLEWFEDEGSDDGEEVVTRYRASHSYVITDLEPNTRYRYDLAVTSRAGERTSTRGLFTTLAIGGTTSSTTTTSTPTVTVTTSSVLTVMERQELLRQLLIQLVQLYQQLLALRAGR